MVALAAKFATSANNAAETGRGGINRVQRAAAGFKNFRGKGAEARGEQAAHELIVPLKTEFLENFQRHCRTSLRKSRRQMSCITLARLPGGVRKVPSQELAVI